MGGKRATVTVRRDATVEDVLGALVDRASELDDLLLAEEGGLPEGIGVLLNDVNVSRKDGLTTSVGPGDVVLIVPPIHGG
jgi:molybdopterin converting factor small subunit